MGHLPNVNPLEPLVTNYRKFFGHGAKVIIDVGTRDGDDLAYLSNQLAYQTTERLIAIDANPEAIELTNNKYGFMEIYETAISNYNGTTKFQKVEHERIDYVGSSSIFANKLVTQKDLIGHVKEIDVNVMTMDHFLYGVGLANKIIDVVKVDIEGYTWEFLEGLTKNLKNVKILHLETEKNPTHKNHKSNFEIQRYMESKGFYLADLSYEWGWEIEDQVWVNKELAINNTECWNR